MVFREMEADLFSMDKTHFLVHCISADFGMGRGIVVQFNQKYDLKHRLQLKYGNWIPFWESTHGDCILEGNVFNLITKCYYYEKPTYDTLRNAILKMRSIVEDRRVKFLAMPRIGCGLDGLQWEYVKSIVENVFKDVDVEIVVCHL